MSIKLFNGKEIPFKDELILKDIEVGEIYFIGILNEYEVWETKGIVEILKTEHFPHHKHTFVVTANRLGPQQNPTLNRRLRFRDDKELALKEGEFYITLTELKTIVGEEPVFYATLAQDYNILIEELVTFYDIRLQREEYGT